MGGGTILLENNCHLIPPTLPLLTTKEGCFEQVSFKTLNLVSSVRSSYSHPDLLLVRTPLFQITPVLNTGLSLSEPLQLYKGYNAI